MSLLAASSPLQFSRTKSDHFRFRFEGFRHGGVAIEGFALRKKVTKLPFLAVKASSRSGDDDNKNESSRLANFVNVGVLTFTVAAVALVSRNRAVAATPPSPVAGQVCVANDEQLSQILPSDPANEVLQFFNFRLT